MSQAKPSQAHACIPYDLFQVTAPVNKQNRDEKSPCHTLAKDNCAHAAVVVGCIPINADAGRSNSAAITPSPDAEGRIRLRDPGIGIGVDGDPMFTMQSSKPHAVAVDLQNVAIGGDIAGTLDTTRPSRGGGQAVAFKPGQSEAAGGTFVTKEVRGSGLRSVGACEGSLRSSLDAEEAWNARQAAEDKERNSKRNVGQTPLCVRRLVPRECEILQ